MVKYCKNLTDNGIKCVSYTRKTCKYPHMMKKYTTVLAALLAVREGVSRDSLSLSLGRLLGALVSKRIN